MTCATTSRVTKYESGKSDIRAVLFYRKQAAYRPMQFVAACKDGGRQLTNDLLLGYQTATYTHVCGRCACRPIYLLAARDQRDAELTNAELIRSSIPCLLTSKWA